MTGPPSVLLSVECSIENGSSYQSKQRKKEAEEGSIGDECDSPKNVRFLLLSRDVRCRSHLSHSSRAKPKVGSPFPSLQSTRPVHEVVTALAFQHLSFPFLRSLLMLVLVMVVPAPRAMNMLMLLLLLVFFLLLLLLFRRSVCRPRRGRVLSVGLVPLVALVLELGVVLQRHGELGSALQVVALEGGRELLDGLLDVLYRRALEGGNGLPRRRGVFQGLPLLHDLHQQFRVREAGPACLTDGVDAVQLQEILGPCRGAAEHLVGGVDGGGSVGTEVLFAFGLGAEEIGVDSALRALEVGVESGDVKVKGLRAGGRRKQKQARRRGR